MRFLNIEISIMSNLNAFGAQLSDFWPYVAKIGKFTKMCLGIKNLLEVFLYYLITVCSWIFIRNMLDNNMYYFDEVTFTPNVMTKKVCVDISHFSVFSYRACAIASEVINLGQM